VKPSRPKYRNTKTNGYDSRREASRATDLHMLEAAGKIFYLREQVEFLLIPKQDGERATKYRADFVYFTHPSMEPEFLVVEDVKGVKTPEYIIKRKLLLYVHGIRIKET
jgi:hypothetical protein